MGRMFCTVPEAARTLNTSEDRIKALVEQGILQEFRYGPHRLLREADIGALDLGRGYPREAQPPVRPHSMTNGHRPPNRRRMTHDQGQRTPGSAVLRSGPSAVRPATCDSSIRQWFWMGLLQDRPTALALLSGLVLLGLAGLAAGICLLQNL